MDKISKIIRQSKYQRFQKPLEAAAICQAARKIAAGRFGVISFKNGLLTLSVENSLQAANLQSESQEIIEKINQKIGERRVQKIRFRIL